MTSSFSVCHCKEADTGWSNQSYCSDPVSLWQPLASWNPGLPVTTGNGLYPKVTILQHLHLWGKEERQQKSRRAKTHKESYTFLLRAELSWSGGSLTCVAWCEPGMRHGFCDNLTWWSQNTTAKSDSFNSLTFNSKTILWAVQFFSIKLF